MHEKDEVRRRNLFPFDVMTNNSPGLCVQEPGVLPCTPKACMYNSEPQSLVSVFRVFHFVVSHRAAG